MIMKSHEAARTFLARFRKCEKTGRNIHEWLMMRDVIFVTRLRERKILAVGVHELHINEILML